MPLEPIGVGSKDKEKEGKEAGEKPRAESESNTPVSSVPSTPVKGWLSSLKNENQFNFFFFSILMLIIACYCFLLCFATCIQSV